MQTESISQTVQQPTDLQLRRGVTRSNARHERAAALTCSIVRHRGETVKGHVRSQHCTTTLTFFAQAVLDARAVHVTSSLADLYDPDTMPANLRAAHARLDTAVDRLYRPAPFASDRDRVEHLFGLYEAMVNPLAREGVKQARRVARRRAKVRDVPDA